MRAALCAVSLVVVAPAWAAGPPSAPARTRVLVLEPTSTNVDKATLETATSLMSVALAKLDRLDVISSAEVKKMAELEAGKQQVGCDSTGCLAELAGAMGARLVVFGDAGRLGSLTILNLSLFDAEKATSVNRVSIKAAALEELPEKIEVAARELVSPVLAEPSAQVTAAAVRDATPPQTSAGGGGSALWTVGVAGGVVLVAGVLFDVFSPTSTDDELSGFDFVGPGLVAVGLGVGAAALLFDPFASEPAPAPAAGAGR
jgi:hypothetical protein